MDASIALPAVVFVVGTVAILVAGARLPLHARAATARFGVSDTALGLFVLAIITSLPELAVTLSAMIGQRAPDLALGNVLGSNNFNLAILAFLPVVVAGRSFMSSVDGPRYSRTAILLLATTALTGAGVLWAARLGSVTAAVLFSLPIAAVFVREVAVGSRGEAAAADALVPTNERPSEDHGRSPFLRFVLYGAVVVAAGVLVSWSGKRIADYPFGGSLRLGETFVGTILVAVATSLPEVTVAFASVRHARSSDMAVGTILGSNSFNLLVFAVGAPLLMFRTNPPISAWSNLSGVNLANVVSGLVLTALALGAVRSRARGGLSLALMVLLVPVYLAGLYFVWRLGAS